jgi:hypothetical protein
MNHSFSLLSIGRVGEPEVRLMDEAEVIDDVLAPVEEMTCLRVIATETGEGEDRCGIGPLFFVSASEDF